MPQSLVLHWHKVADAIDALPWQPNNMCEVEADAKTICLHNNNGQVTACTHKCPHAGGRMADGYTDALGNIVCPLHRYRFSLTNGRNVSGEGYYLKTYPVKHDETGLYIGIAPKTGLFGF